MTPLFCNKTEFNSSSDGTIVMSFFYTDKDGKDSSVADVAVNFPHFKQITSALNEFLTKITTPAAPVGSSADATAIPDATLPTEDAPVADVGSQAA